MSLKYFDFLKQIINRKEGDPVEMVRNVDPLGKSEIGWGIKEFKTEYSTRFNMCGYCAPKLDVVRIGFIGLGERGSNAVVRISQIEGVEIKALSDQREASVKASQSYLTGKGIPVVAEYFGKEEGWKEMCDRDDVDLVYICTPWHQHTPMAVYAMEHGKH
ncbi:MAG: Gfo/Idh/MocA family oxidoreductase, partial [Bacteroidota bacterium]|nr:Gfo/Idh/MocA family oxidoreductase [Bacteroidota bacterium]